MSGNLEEASGTRRGDFPAEWGEPEGTPYSSTRAAWMRTRVAMPHTKAKRSATAALARVRALANRDT